MLQNVQFEHAPWSSRTSTGGCVSFNDCLSAEVRENLERPDQSRQFVTCVQCVSHRLKGHSHERAVLYVREMRRLRTGNLRLLQGFDHRSEFRLCSKYLGRGLHTAPPTALALICCLRESFSVSLSERCRLRGQTCKGVVRVPE
ncbi:hypothetical protein CSKR_202829 [Clonorchis sinensis]|uniref:Uncharacterized protein n=1 Tax=Clonorchis sinensis TaxID=79923 RepID=A0A8T1M3W8_CLOSI|nr:hypothetical protein CSKR_202829 [Clonorchis sinensis]